MVVSNVRRAEFYVYVMYGFVSQSRTVNRAFYLEILCKKPDFRQSRNWFSTENGMISFSDSGRVTLFYSSEWKWT